MAPGWVAWSYFKGAARERLAPASHGRLPARETALLAVISLAGLSVALSFAPPTAGATSVRAEVTERAEAAAGYGASAGTFRPGDLIGCGNVVGQSVEDALAALDHPGVRLVWDDVYGARARSGTEPPGWYRVIGARALSATVISLDVAPPGRSATRPEGPRGRHC